MHDINDIGSVFLGHRSIDRRELLDASNRHEKVTTSRARIEHVSTFVATVRVDLNESEVNILVGDVVGVRRSAPIARQHDESIVHVQIDENRLAGFFVENEIVSGGIEHG